MKAARSLLVLVVVVVGLAGCGGGPSADQWAGDVCAALAPWRIQIGQLNRDAATQMAAATTATETRANLVRLVSGAEAASETARAAVVAAGVPDVDGGADVASSFTAALTGARDAYARARADLQALSTADESAFYDGVQAVLVRLNEEYARSGVDPGSLSSAELRQAFDGNGSCR